MLSLVYHQIQSDMMKSWLKNQLNFYVFIRQILRLVLDEISGILAQMYSEKQWKIWY